MQLFCCAHYFMRTWIREQCIYQLFQIKAFPFILWNSKEKKNQGGILQKYI